MPTFPPNNKRSPDEDWIPCKPGILNAYKFETSLNSVSRRTAIFQMCMIYGSGIFIAGASIGSLLRNSSGSLIQPARIPCDEVKAHLCKYVANAIPCKDLRASIAHHLVECPICDCMYQKMSGNDQGLSQHQWRRLKKQQCQAENREEKQEISPEDGQPVRKALP